jgi:hypothetical protein
MDGTQTLRLFVSEDEAEPERVDQLTRYLRDQLVALDVAEVTAIRSGEIPAGARSGVGIAVGGLLVGLMKSQDSIRAVMSLIVRWLDRSPVGGRSVRIEMDGDVLVLSRASAAEESQLIDLFVSRHLRDGA